MDGGACDESGICECADSRPRRIREITTTEVLRYIQKGQTAISPPTFISKVNNICQVIAGNRPPFETFQRWGLGVDYQVFHLFIL